MITAQRVSSFLIAVITIIAFSVLGPSEDSLAVGVCDIIVEAEEMPDTGMEFEFSATAPGPEEFSLSTGEQQELNELLFGDEVTVTQQVPTGFILESVVCEVTGGNFSPIINEIENGFVIDCEGEAPPGQDPEDSDITCTFSNISASRSIPALSDWGLLGLAAVFVLAGVWGITRKKAQA